MLRRICSLALIGVLACGLAACGGDDDNDDAAASDPATTITITNFAFSLLTVAPGATVTVKNDDSTPHSVVSDKDDQFATPNLDNGKSATFTAPSEPGNYAYHCGIHASTMKGTLTVK